MTYNTILQEVNEHNYILASEVETKKHFEFIGKIYPLIVKLCLIRNVSISMLPHFEINKTVHLIQTSKLRARLFVGESLPIEVFDEDINRLKFMLDDNVGEIVIYALQSTPIMYTPGDYKSLVGILIRSKNIKKENYEVN